jgi:hypothetical protein
VTDLSVGARLGVIGGGLTLTDLAGTDDEEIYTE